MPRSGGRRARDWLGRIGLIERADWDAANLPYGDQRRLEIARAMCTEPKLLCLDEPAAGLNPRETAELGQLLMRIRDEYGIGVLLIEHDMSVVMGISTTSSCSTTAARSRTAPRTRSSATNVIKAYLGARGGGAAARGRRRSRGRSSAKLMLEVAGLHAHYGNIEALHGVSIRSIVARSSPSSAPTAPASRPC